MSQTAVEAESPEKQTVNPVVSDTGPVFSEQEWARLQNEDYAAAKLVVVIMGCVFSAGLALYAFIACLVAMGGH